MKTKFEQFCSDHAVGITTGSILLIGILIGRKMRTKYIPFDGKLFSDTEWASFSEEAQRGLVEIARAMERKGCFICMKG